MAETAMTSVNQIASDKWRNRCRSKIYFILGVVMFAAAIATKSWLSIEIRSGMGMCAAFWLGVAIEAWDQSR